MAADLYQQAILDLARQARQQGRLEAPDASATVDNPLCGDRVTIDIALADGRIAAIGHKVRGCLLCEAAAAAIALRAPGASAAELGALQQDLRTALKEAPERLGSLWPELAAFTPVHGHKSRHDCVLLPFQALARALRDRQVQQAGD